MFYLCCKESVLKHLNDLYNSLIYKTNSIMLTIAKNDNIKINQLNINVYNTLSIIETEILVQNRYSDFKTLKIGDSVPSNFGAHITEHMYQTQLEFMIFFNLNKNDLTFVELSGNIITNVGKVRNLFSGKYQVLKLIKNINLSSKSLYLIKDSNYTKHQQQHSSNLSDIINKLGIPHYIINSPDMKDILVYFGFHSCKKGVKIGILCLIVDINNEIYGMIKHFQICKDCCDFLSVEEISEIESVDY